MTDKQNQALINLMLSGELVSHFSAENETCMVYVYRKGAFAWVTVDAEGLEISWEKDGAV